MSEPVGNSVAARLALPAAPRSHARRLRFESRVVLFAVCGLVFLVSLPRLRGIAIQENELDALRALQLLSREMESAAARGEVPATIGELLPEDSSLRRRLGDVETLADGALALRHGYLFELGSDEAGEPLLCAWPLRRGSTGLATFAAEPGRGVFGRASKEGPGAGWSGPSAHPARGLALDPTDGWRCLELSSTRTESY